VAATIGADFYAKVGSEYHHHRDVVLVDQRGTGKLKSIDRRSRDQAARRTILTEMYPVEYVKTLRQALEQRADLTQYTTPSRWMISMMCAPGSAMSASTYSASPMERAQC